MTRRIKHIENKDFFYYEIKDSFILECNKSTRTCPDVDKVGRYLENVIPYNIHLDLTKCICCKKSISHSNTYLCDGRWAWSGDLNHYFENHFFQFPQEFLKDMKSNHYKTKTLMDPLSFNIDASHKLGVELGQILNNHELTEFERVCKKKKEVTLITK